MSTEQVAKSGANPFGIIPVEFIFYPSGYQPVQRDSDGHGPADYAARGIPWQSPNAPAWAICHSDLAKLHHGEVDLERLFVAHWGSEPEQLGVDEKRSRFRYAPSDYWVGPGQTVTFWDEWRGRLTTFDYRGRLLRTDKIVKGTVPKGPEWRTHAGKLTELLRTETRGKALFDAVDGSNIYQSPTGRFFALDGSAQAGGLIRIWDKQARSIESIACLPGSSINFGYPDPEHTAMEDLTSFDGSDVIQINGHIGAGDSYVLSGLYAQVDELGDVIHVVVSGAGIEVFRYKVAPAP